MKNIGLITLNGYENYGNRLQNYALKKHLQDQGFSVDNIWQLTPVEYIKIRIKRLIKSRKRFKNFYEFDKVYIKSKYVFDIKKVAQNYDRFIVGSDQVWNYSFNDFNDLFFLLFSERNKNIAYAASFGVDSIPETLVEYYKKGLNNIKYLSTREETGKNIVEKITGRNDIDCVIDPTMLIDPNDWEEIAHPPENFRNNKYIFIYFLGELSDNVYQDIVRFAENQECTIVNILDENDLYYSVGPSEFLFLVKNAFFVCTDSFHASVFSILFERPFLVYDRNNNGENVMGSRIETILNTFHLEERKVSNQVLGLKYLECDYSNNEKILKEQKQKAINFLNKAVKDVVL